MARWIPVVPEGDCLDCVYVDFAESWRTMSFVEIAVLMFLLVLLGVAQTQPVNGLDSHDQLPGPPDGRLTEKVMAHKR